MTIQTAAAYFEANPGTALKRVEVECGCAQTPLTKRADYQPHTIALGQGQVVGHCRRPDLSTILVCTEAGEVEILCEIDEWCLACQEEGRRQAEGLTPSDEGHDSHPSCLVTHRIFAWGGEEVEWEKVLLMHCPKCGAFDPKAETTLEDGEESCEDAHLIVGLTAVVLVGEVEACRCSEGVDWDCQHYAVQAAREACAEAGVKFYGAMP